MSYEESYKTLGERIAAALRRRVGVGRAIGVKQLAYALRVSEGTIWNLMSGNNEPSGRVLMALVQFFDAAFANEIFAGTGATIVKLGESRAAENAARKIAEGMEELKRLDGAT